MMHHPPHPGDVIRELCLDPLAVSVTEAAKAMGITRKALSELLNGHTGITPAMALRLSLAFGGSAESWLTQQAQYDLWKIRRNPPKVKRLRAG